MKMQFTIWYTEPTDEPTSTPDSGASVSTSVASFYGLSGGMLFRSIAVSATIVIAHGIFFV